MATASHDTGCGRCRRQPPFWVRPPASQPSRRKGGFLSSLLSSLFPFASSQFSLLSLSDGGGGGSLVTSVFACLPPPPSLFLGRLYSLAATMSLCACGRGKYDDGGRAKPRFIPTPPGLFTRRIIRFFVVLWSFERKKGRRKEGNRTFLVFSYSFFFRPSPPSVLSNGTPEPKAYLKGPLALAVAAGGAASPPPSPLSPLLRRILQSDANTFFSGGVFSLRRSTHLLFSLRRFSFRLSFLRRIK